MKKTTFALLLVLITFSFAISSCDPCKDVDCKNGGTCDDGNCECPTGTEGSMCETVWRDGILGTYNCKKKCNGSDQDDQVIVLKADHTATQLSVEFEGGITPCKMTSKNSFSYSQSFIGEDYELTGTVTGNDITITQSSSSASTGINITCTFTGTKQ